MDFNNLKESVANLTLYDLKAGVRKVQNAVMNYTEMEAKVREATNNDPWGTSSTLMQEIANGTFSYQTLNEIMPMIYRRFTEKSAEEWRQIYKALQLLEFLVKHGSERVVDDARSHMTLLKMLRQFHYIDPNGKDQGINVRNRAKELAELLSDVDRIRAERKKARANKGKYTGVGNTSMGGLGLGGGSRSGSSRYGGFGSDSASFGGYAGGVYGDGGGFGGQSEPYEGGSGGGGGGNDRFEEYDEYDEGESRAGSSRAGVRRTTGGTASASTTTTTKKAPEPAPKKAPEVDLFSFDDPEPTAAASAAAGAANDDDDFDDFQEAAPVVAAAAPAAGASSSLAGLSLASPPLTTSHAGGATFAAPQPVSAPQQVSLSDMMSSISPPPAATPTSTGGPNYSAFHAPPLAAAPAAGVAGSKAPTTASFQPIQPNYYQSVQVSPTGAAAPLGSSSAQALKPVTSVFPQTSQQQQRHVSTGSSSVGAGMAALRPVLPSHGSTASSASAAAKPAAMAAGAAKPAAAGGDVFGSLWSQAATGIKKNNTGSTSKGPSMGQLAQEKIWGATPSVSSTPAPSTKPAASSSSGLDDLLG